MRRIKKEELNKLYNFITEQYFEKEELQKTFKGINQDKAKKIAVEMVSLEMDYFFKNGDIFIYDDNITAVVIGIEHKKISVLKALPSAFKANKIMKQFSKEELKIMNENRKILNKVNNSKWFKKYCENPYCFSQFAIDKDKRGNGIAREMMEFIVEYVKDKTKYIRVELLSKEYVPMCEHFGFELKETVETEDKELKQYRMLKEV